MRTPRGELKKGGGSRPKIFIIANHRGKLIEFFYLVKNYSSEDLVELSPVSQDGYARTNGPSLPLIEGLGSELL